MNLINTSSQSLLKLKPMRKITSYIPLYITESQLQNLNLIFIPIPYK